MKIECCRLCKGQDLQGALDLGEMAFSGIFPKNGQKVPTGHLEIVVCASCGLAQLSENFDLNLMYGDNYGYRSGLNKSMVNHLKGIADYASKWLEPGDQILDIGSNDGTLLGHYPKNVTRVGIDPTSDKFAEFYDPDIIRLCDFFPSDDFQKAGRVLNLWEFEQFKIITSIACFYDSQDPADFALGVRENLHPEGVWIFEQSYLPTMIKQNAYDTICHEHLEYYALEQIEEIVFEAGMKILNASLNDCNGGSMRITAVRDDSSFTSSHIAREFTESENTSIESLQGLADFCKQHSEDLPTLLWGLKQSGKRVYGYGASTKGNIVLQNCGIGPDLLEGILEINPDKFGCVTPGTEIPIVSEAPDADVYLVLPWHFRESIIEREQEFLKGGGGLLFPLPEIEMVNA